MSYHRVFDRPAGFFRDKETEAHFESAVAWTEGSTLRIKAYPFPLYPDHLEAIDAAWAERARPVGHAERRG